MTKPLAAMSARIDRLGNVIIGYNAQRTTAATRTGSHYLVVGDQHEWTGYGGIFNGSRTPPPALRRRLREAGARVSPTTTTS